MPTVLRYGSMRFQIYVGNEHEPPHVHVKLPDAEVVVILVEQTRTGSIRDINGPVRNSDLVRIVAIVAEHFETLIAVWSRYHR